MIVFWIKNQNIFRCDIKIPRTFKKKQERILENGLYKQLHLK